MNEPTNNRNKTESIKRITVYEETVVIIQRQAQVRKRTEKINEMSIKLDSILKVIPDTAR